MRSGTGTSASSSRAAYRKRYGDWLWIYAVFGILVLGSLAYTLNVSWHAITNVRTLSNFLSMVAEMLPPDFRVVPTLGEAILETMTMSVMATLLAVALSFPFAFLASEKTGVHPVIRFLMKSVFNALRTVPELILAILFVASVGFGILPGILALGVHSAGMLGKFYAEAIDKVDDGIIEAVQASGGSRFHVVVFGIIPQIASYCIDFTLYRWEYNFRASTVVGMIGAGGVGFQLIASLRIMQYQDVLAILLVVFVLVQLVDAFGNRIRQLLMGKEQQQ